MMLGCAGGSTVVNSGTPLGSYTVTVTGTSGSGADVVTKTVRIALGVQ